MGMKTYWRLNYLSAKVPFPISSQRSVTPRRDISCPSTPDTPLPACKLPLIKKHTKCSIIFLPSGPQSSGHAPSSSFKFLKAQGPWPLIPVHAPLMPWDMGLKLTRTKNKCGNLFALWRQHSIPTGSSMAPMHQFIAIAFMELGREVSRGRLLLQHIIHALPHIVHRPVQGGEDLRETQQVLQDRRYPVCRSFFIPEKKKVKIEFDQKVYKVGKFELRKMMEPVKSCLNNRNRSGRRRAGTQSGGLVVYCSAGRTRESQRQSSWHQFATASEQKSKKRCWISFDEKSFPLKNTISTFVTEF